MADLRRRQIITELREMSSADLHKEIADQRASLYDLRRRNFMKQLENTAAIRTARKQIARALTLLRERELSARGGQK
ncbi:MAG TPA: 50S ribosomal protein L29 [Chthonomonadales bacterium]|nr:50S ribosomal protein L29 [Chthonomonadales bacterium]